MEPVYVITDVDPETTVLTYHQHRALLIGKDRVSTDTAEVFAEEICASTVASLSTLESRGRG